MPLPLLNRDTLSVYVNAARELKADTPRRFGKMAPSDMVRHLRHTLEVSYGEKEEPDRSTWFSRGIGRVLIFHLITRWPGGILKQPDAWTPAPENEFDVEHQKFLDALERFVDELVKAPERKTVSPILGPRTLEYWGHIHAVHMSHHFRQFKLS